MVYRRTEKVRKRLAQRHAAIVAAARDIAAEGGMAALQIVPVAARAGIAAGTVYRYFPSKTELVGALMAAVSEQEIEAMRRAADTAPGPLSALSASVATFAARALSRRRLSWALLAESADPEVEGFRRGYRKALAEEVEKRITAAMVAQRLPEQDAGVTARAVVGALLESLIEPKASPGPDDPARIHDKVRTLTLLVLRGLGVVDAQARGLVVQTVLPLTGEVA